MYGYIIKKMKIVPEKRRVTTEGNIGRVHVGVGGMDTFNVMAPGFHEAVATCDW